MMLRDELASGRLWRLAAQRGLLDRSRLGAGAVVLSDGGAVWEVAVSSAGNRMEGLARAAAALLIPSWREVNMSLVTAVLVIVLFVLLQHALEREAPRASPASWQHARKKPRALRKARKETKLEQFETTVVAPAPPVHDADEVKAQKAEADIPESSAGHMHQIHLQLLAAKNLKAANISGTSDPYAVITCGSQKRFSSAVMGSRNPMWGEEFDFYTEEMPVKILISIYDWDIISKSSELGSTTIVIEEGEEREADWYFLDRTSGQVCLQLQSKMLATTLSGPSNGSMGRGFPSALKLRRYSHGGSTEQVATEVHQKPGPLQTIFDLPPDEVVLHTFSCGLERSFLYHGRMYISAWHICFHSNLFKKQLKMRRSQHAMINPSITLILRAGAGGHGVPPLASPDGRAKYKFASFWNRNHTLRLLQKAVADYATMEQVEVQEAEQSLMRAQSGRVDLDFELDGALATLPRSPPQSKPVQPFLSHEVLQPLVSDSLPCTAEEYFASLLDDSSTFTSTYRNARKDSELKVEKWHVSEQFGGMVRKIDFRSLCNSPMCPPSTSMTDWQRTCFEDDKSTLLLETVLQAHDVPFGTYFEVQALWRIRNESSSTCTVTVTSGVHFKKWTVMSAKIRSGAASEYKLDAMLILDLAKKEVEARRQSASASQQHVPTVADAESRTSSPSLASVDTEAAPKRLLPDSDPRIGPILKDGSNTPMRRH
eukprot:SM000003S11128  [mRNA]  locus=s3:1164169:1170142:+ [translate_table: standard]